MGDYKPTNFQEIVDQMPEEKRRRMEERVSVLMAEDAFWDGLPEDERNKRLQKPKVAYDADSDTLWLKNGRPMHRSFEIVKDRVTAYFEAEIWYPSAVAIVGPHELLGRFFCPELSPGTDSLVRKYGVEEGIERLLKLEYLEVSHEKLSDYLWIGNGKRPGDGAEIAEDLIVSYAEDGHTPVGVALFRAAELLTPALAKAAA
jgi:uncharacterized protein YuzE